MNEERIKHLRSFILEDPGNPFNKYALAMEYYESDAQSSLELLVSLMEEHPDYLPTYYKAAHLFWESEQWEKADTVFQKGMKLASDQQDQKTLNELKSSYQNFLFEKD